MRRSSTMALLTLALFLGRTTAARGSESALALKKRASWVRLALASRGVPYRWGGTSMRGFDCSGLVAYVARSRGLTLPHSAHLQARYGFPVAFQRLEAGDLLFFGTRRGIGHVGIYLGCGKFIHAPRPGRRVSVECLRGWYRNRLVAARSLYR